MWDNKTFERWGGKAPRAGQWMYVAHRLTKKGLKYTDY